MRNQIRADLRRILKKPMIYIWLAVTFLLLAFASGRTDYTNDTLEYERTFMALVCPTIVAIPVYLSVFGDEVKCGAVQCIIGRGISRSKVVLAKFLECLILSGIFFVVIEAVMYGRNMLFNVGTTPLQDATLFLYIFMIYLKTVGFIAFASFFVYLSWSTAPGMAILVSAITLLSMVLQFAQQYTHVPVYDYSYEGLIDSAYAAISAGNAGFTLLPAVLLVVAALILTMVVFNKKEIEF